MKSKSKSGEKESRESAKALNYALFLLGRRSYTVGELGKKLSRKGCDAAEARRVLDKLISSRLLDDFEYAKNFVRQAKEIAPKGKRRIIFELNLKGVEKELIERALREEGYFEKEEDMIEQSLRLYLKKAGVLSLRKKRCRALAYLARRGFDYAGSLKAVDAAIPRGDF